MLHLNSRVRSIHNHLLESSDARACKKIRKTAVGSNLVLLHCFYYYCITITDAGLRTANWNYFIL